MDITHHPTPSDCTITPPNGEILNDDKPSIKSGDVVSIETVFNVLLFLMKNIFPAFDEANGKVIGSKIKYEVAELSATIGIGTSELIKDNGAKPIVNADETFLSIETPEINEDVLLLTVELKLVLTLDVYNLPAKAVPKLKPPP